LQNWPNMLVHKQLLQFLPNSFDTCHKLISGVVDVYDAISAWVSIVLVELWPFHIVKMGQKCQLIEQLLQFLPDLFDACHKLISGVVDVYDAIFAWVSLVIMELWPFNIAKMG